LFALCLAFGVAAIVAVAALAEGLDRTVRQEAKQLLGGDLRASSRQPLAETLGASIPALVGADHTDLRELLTMVAVADPARGGASRLVELAAVENTYPLLGELTTDPTGDVADLLADRGLLIAPDLAAQLAVGVGDPIQVGSESFTVRGLLLDEPGHSLTPFQIGPRVLMSASDLAATGLEGFGSRIQYQRLYRLSTNPSPDEFEELVDDLREAAEQTQGSVRITSYVEAQNGIRASLERLSNFLGLVALLSLLIGGIGVAQSVRSFLASRLDAIATAKCLGLRPREGFLLYLGQVLLLAVVGSVAGGILGLTLQLYLPRLLGDLVPADALAFWRPRALLQGVVLGLATSLGFALLPLLSVLTVPPLRAFRRDAEPLPTPRGWQSTVVGLLLVGLVAIARVQSGSFLTAGVFALGVLGTAGVLFAGALALQRSAGQLRRVGALPLSLRQGAAQLARPGLSNLAATAALGLGTAVVLTTALVQQHLTTQLDADLPLGAPGTFLVGIQPDQWPQLQEDLAAFGVDNLDSVPEVLSRLAAIDGVPISALVENVDEDRRWALTREQRLTYLETLPEDNEVIAGQWWNEDPGLEVSLEKDYAADLGVEVGSQILFDIQGVPIELEVTSLRQVDWRSFRINYFIVVAPGILEEAPQSRLAAATLPLGREQEIQDQIIAQFPNITFADVRSMLKRISSLLTKLGLGVRFLGGFTALAGLLILFGSVAATSVRRSGDLALLKALGFTRWGASGVLLAELGLTGLVAGVLGSLCAGVASWLVATQLLDVDPHLFPLTYVVVVLSTLVATCSAGAIAGFDALRRSPAEVFRNEIE
ncbi:MAG: ABC transporter permease, partial [Thermoanaerobaculia bacterium]|nr:ABC transporter permease [Thermoanaerobaculia bacterium]